MVLIPDKMFSRMASYFNRSFETLGDKKKTSDGVAPQAGHFASRVYLPNNGASFEFQDMPDSSHSESMKTSQEA